MQTVTATVLDDDTLAMIRLECAAARSPFIDPALLREAQELMHLAPADWLNRVAGRDVRSWTYLSNIELAVALRAIKADRAHLAARAAAQRAEWDRQARERLEVERAAAQAERDQWQALRARLPVPVTVGHNWTARHLDPYVQGADHIVVQADLTVGRFRRDARSPLCWTPSRSHELRHVELSDDGEDRIPTCKACLRHAERLAGS
jgi:hypothetical protein